MTPDKPRFPRALALAAARDICQALQPVTQRLVVAGSLRRGASLVGDVEILYIPRFEDRQIDLITTGPVSLADEAIQSLLSSGSLTMRPMKNGSYTWGSQNKLARHRNGVPVDLFAATHESWWNYLVCRTGPATLTTRIAIEARMLGFRWNPYGPGFSSIADDSLVPMPSEEAVFNFVHLPFLPPAKRA